MEEAAPVVLLDLAVLVVNLICSSLLGEALMGSFGFPEAVPVGAAVPVETEVAAEAAVLVETEVAAGAAVFVEIEEVAGVVAVVEAAAVALEFGLEC